MRINDAQTYARRNMTEAVVRQQRQYHQERKSFWPGIKIWLLTPSVKPGTARKLANPWSGPWVVRVNDVMVCIQPHPDWSDSQATRVVSIDHLKLYGNEATVRPPDDDANLDMASAEYVKHVDNGGVGPPPPPPGGGGGGGGGGGAAGATASFTRRTACPRPSTSRLSRHQRRRDARSPSATTTYSPTVPTPRATRPPGAPGTPTSTTTTGTRTTGGQAGGERGILPPAGKTRTGGAGRSQSVRATGAPTAD